MKITQLIICFAAALIITTVASAQTDTTFTFQGELKQHGSPVNGAFNMTFTLFDSAGGGIVVGVPVVHGAMPVVDGKFTAELDFGATAFEGNRWLEIQVNGVALTPRTPITHAPYSIQTRGIFVNEDATSVRIGPPGVASDPASVLTVVRNTSISDEFGGMSVETTGADGNPTYAYAAGGTYLAYHYVEGSTGKWHLVPDSSNIALTVTPSGRVGIGTESPTANAKFEVISDAAPVNVSLRAQNDVDNGAGVVGIASGEDGFGVFGFAFEGDGGWGVFGQSASPGGEAGHFSGDVNVVGTLSKSAGAFKIDHPLDPENKYLSHSFVESSDMMNVYNGNIVTDADGYATVVMPAWFEVLNRDFRYQLTVIDGANSDTFVLAKVVEEIKNNQFRIRTSVPSTKVSWQVTGVRHDPYAEANRIQVEEMKPTKLRGLYRHPELYGRTADLREESIKLSADMRQPLTSSKASDQVDLNSRQEQH